MSLRQFRAIVRLTENMTEKKKRIAELEAIKKRDQEQIELNMRLALEKEQARE